MDMTFFIRHYKALETGNGALVNFPPTEFLKGKTIIYVKDTLKALQDIAHYLRMRSNIPVIGITGTNGKTTTKGLIASILLCIGTEQCIEINLSIQGTFNIYNALAAASIGSIFNITLSDIKTGIESFTGVPMNIRLNYNGEENILMLLRGKNER